MSLKIYHYNKCSTCRKATHFLDENKIPYTTIPIREQPPTKTELRKLLAAYGGNVRKLFNTSGMDYRQLGIKDKLPNLSTDDVIDLLATNGNLIKRPVALSRSHAVAGFKEALWQESFLR